jgi:serine/threonine protein kinase
MSTNKLKSSRSKGKKCINQYIIEKELGKGSFATVHLGYDKETKNKYAIKEMNKALLMKKRIGNGNAFDCVLAELKVLQRLQHPNIIWLHEVIDDPKKDMIFLVTEWQKKGSVTPMSGKERLYFIDMLKALHYCHEVAKVVHRDIKPDNIMLNHNDEAVLIDFGVSEIVDKPEDLMLN